MIIADSAETPDNYVYFDIEGVAEGTFSESIEGSACFEYVIPAGNNFLDESTTPGDFTFTISEFGDVGGTIKGTFSGEVKESGTANVYALTNGFFEVMRKADNSIGLE